MTRDITERKRADETLRYQARLLESLHDAVIATDERFVVTAWNRSAEEMFGWTTDEALGRFVYEVIPTEYDEEELAQALRQVTEVGHRTAEGPLWHHKDGATVCAESRVVALTDDGGRITGYLSIMRDISDRVRAMEEIERRTHQQAVVAELGLLALAGHDLQTLMDDVVARVCEALGVEQARIDERSGDELLLRAGAGWRHGANGNGGGAPRSPFRYALTSDEPVVIEDLSADTRFSSTPLLRDHGVVSGIIVVIPGRERPYGAMGAFATGHRMFSGDDVNFLLAVSNVLATAVERAAVEARLHEVRESERSRIARDLHDEALRDLAYALTQAQELASAAEPSAAEKLQPLVAALKQVGLQVRGAIHHLRLGAEEHRPFSGLLESLVAVHASMAPALDVQLDLRDGTPRRSLGQRGVQLQRIIGEALTNARRHSGADMVRVVAWGSPGMLWLEVADNGHGVDGGDPPELVEGTGMKGMRERAVLIGAELTIGSPTGQGTTVRVGLPLRQHGDGAEGRIRVLLVEDHAAVRQAIASTLQREGGFEIVGQAASLAEARQILAGVDVAVIDLRLPDGYGGDLIEEIRQANPDAQALVLSASLDRVEMARAVESGAAGLLHKTAGLDEVVDAVRRVRAGEILLPLSEVVELLRLAGSARERQHESREVAGRLTGREREVLQALADGLDNSGVAQRLRISIRTERNHMASILAKVGAHSQLQAVVFAVRHGVVTIR